MNTQRSTEAFLALFLCFKLVSAQAVVPADREALLKGEGMGMAVPAEANAFPGPKHVLEFREELGLSHEQTTKAQNLFERMKSSAIAKGQEIIKAEEILFGEFHDRSVEDKTLEKKILKIARLRGELRFIHLHTHLLMTQVLTPEQVKHYNELRNHGTRH